MGGIVGKGVCHRRSGRRLEKNKTQGQVGGWGNDFDQSMFFGEEWAESWGKEFVTGEVVGGWKKTRLRVRWEDGVTTSISREHLCERSSVLTVNPHPSQDSQEDTQGRLGNEDEYESSSVATLNPDPEPSQDSQDDTEDPPVSTASLSMDPPVSTASLSMHPSVSTASPSMDPPASTASLSMDPPVPTASLSMNIPMSTASLSIDPPVSTASLSMDPPVSTALLSMDAPVSTASLSMNSPLSTASLSMDPPVSTASLSMDPSMSTASLSMDPPVSIASLTMDPPVSTASLSMDAPVSTASLSMDPSHNSPPTACSVDGLEDVFGDSDDLLDSDADPDFVMTPPVSTASLSMNPPLPTASLSMNLPMSTASLSMDPSHNSLPTACSVDGLEDLFGDGDDLFDSDADPDFVMTSGDNDSSDVEMDEPIPVVAAEPKKTSNNKAEDENEYEADDEAPLFQRVTTVPEVSRTSGIFPKKTKDGHKQHLCFICRQYRYNLHRHFVKQHSEVLEVAKVLALPRGKSRTAQMSILIHKGDLLDKLDKKEGKHNDVLPCPQCGRLLKPKYLSQHIKAACQARDENSRSLAKRAQSTARWMVPTAVGRFQSEFQTKVMTRMKDDHITKVISRSNAILQYGHRIYQKLGFSQHHLNHISQKMRETSRLLIEIRKNMGSNSVTLEELLHPIHFDAVMEGIQSVAGWDSVNFSFDKPELARKLVMNVKHIAKLLAGENLKLDNAIAAKDFHSFVNVLEAEATSLITSHSVRERNENRMNNPYLLPTIEDTQNFCRHLRSTVLQDIHNLEKYPNPTNYQALGKSLLALVISFNRRRSGESERVTVEQYQLSQKQSIDDVVMTALSPLEKELSRSLHRVEVRGKKGKVVPVLLTKEMKRACDVLLEKRFEVGVDKKNIYLFARPFFGAQTPLRGTDAIREHSEKCGAENPQRLRSTSMRKQLATVTQVCSLDEGELEHVANYMGHDLRVHRDFYRLPTNTIQLAKVSKLLIEIEKGNVEGLKGKTLDNIEVNLSDRLEEENFSDEELTPSRAQYDDLEDEADVESTRMATTVSTRRRNNKIVVFTAWSEAEKKAVLNHPITKELLSQKRIPRKQDCDQVIKDAPELLRNRPWQKVKFFIVNQSRKKAVL
ncbi:unnamed protein product, partial [Cyprideis torosa]